MKLKLKSPLVYVCGGVCALSHSVESNSLWPAWTVAHQAPLSIGVFWKGILDWVSISFSKESSQPRGQTLIFCVSCITGRFFTAELLGKPPLVYGLLPRPYTSFCIQNYSALFLLKNDLKLQKPCSHKTWIQPWVWGLNMNHYHILSVEVGKSLSVGDQS